MVLGWDRCWQGSNPKSFDVRKLSFTHSRNEDEIYIQGQRDQVCLSVLSRLTKLTSNRKKRTSLINTFIVFLGNLSDLSFVVSFQTKFRGRKPHFAKKNRYVDYFQRI